MFRDARMTAAWSNGPQGAGKPGSVIGTMQAALLRLNDGHPPA